MTKVNEVLCLRKTGGFYHAFDDDCYILYYLFGYNITNGKSGFPVSALNKVINRLEDMKVSYTIIKEGEKENKNFKNLNTYLKYKKLGEEKLKIDEEKQALEEKILNLPTEKFDRIYQIMEKVLHE